MNKWMAICVMFLFVVCFAGPASAGHDPKVDCVQGTFVSGDDDDPGDNPGNPSTNKKHKNYLNKGEWIRWDVTAPEGTLVTIAFTKKTNYDGTNTLGTTPFNDPLQVLHFKIEKKTNGDKVKWGRIRSDLPDGAHGYKITCTFEDGRTPTEIDPIIEVPRTGGLTPPPPPQTQPQTKD